MPDKIRIHMLEAGQGDAFIISCGIGENKKNIMIDGGTGNSYMNSLKNCIKKFREKEEKIDLLIITHIDNDHIDGAIELLKDNVSSEKSEVIKIEEVWHNSYLQLQLDKQNQISDHQLRVLEEIKNRGDGRDEYGRYEINAKKASFFGSQLYEGVYNWNTQTSGKAISVQNLPVYHITNELSIHLLSPTDECLEELKAFWLSELNKRNYVGIPSTDRLFDDAYEMLLRRIEEDSNKRQDDKKSKISVSSTAWEDYINEEASEDNKPANKSSIAFVLKFKNKRILFLGDAVPSIIEKNLRKIYEFEVQPYKFDAVKISHHGSSRNISPELLKIIDSPKYLFSTNGRYGHPDLSTLVKITENYPSMQIKKELIFNYKNNSEEWINSNTEKMRNLNYKIKISTYEEV